MYLPDDMRIDFLDGRSIAQASTCARGQAARGGGGGRDPLVPSDGRGSVGNSLAHRGR